MERFNGKIIDEAGTTIDGIAGTFSVQRGNPLSSWSGTMHLPLGVMPGAFRLVLDDGREARIIIKKVEINPSGGPATFIGTGPPPT